MKRLLKGILFLICLCITLVVIVIIFFGEYLINIELIGDKEISLGANTKYFENGYNAYLLDMIDITKFVKTDNNINNKEIGNYTVTYKIDYIVGRKVIYRNVNVVDKKKPVITLEGDTDTYINRYYDYVEPGYTAIDNYDGDITSSVKVTSNVDNTKLGNYQITYEVEDKAGNKTSITRNVTVIDNDILTRPLSEFTLKGLSDNIVLTPEDEEQDYMNEGVLVGDSNIRYLYKYGNYLNAEQVWTKNNLNAGDINTTKIEIMATGENLTVFEAVEKYKPKYLVVSFGLTSSSFLTKETFDTNVRLFFDTMKEKYPETKVVVISILPVTTAQRGLIYSSNKYNYYLMQICSEYKIGFIDVTDELKDSTGYGSTEYFYCKDEDDCGFHLSEKGKEYYTSYLKRINLAKEIN